MLLGEAMCFAIAGSCPVLYLEQVALEGEKSVGNFIIRVLFIGHPLEWGMVHD